MANESNNVPELLGDYAPTDTLPGNLGFVVGIFIGFFSFFAFITLGGFAAYTLFGAK